MALTRKCNFSSACQAAGIADSVKMGDGGSSHVTAAYD